MTVSADDGSITDHAGWQDHAAKWALLAVFLLTVGLSAALTVRDFAVYLPAAGPNTVGEAGKVYFARRVQAGQWPVATAEQPPHYPSVHGFLLHSVVGWLGRACGLPVSGLYYLGRGVSAVMTVFAMVLAWSLLRRLGVRWVWMVVGLVVLLGPRVVVQHTVSYRPDNWVWAVSLACCLLVSCARPRWLTAVALMLLATAAFHFKASGGVILGAAAVALVMQHQRRMAIIVFVGGVAAIGLSLLLLNTASGGAYGRAMHEGLSNPASVSTMLRSVSFAPLWLPLLLPLALAGRWLALGMPADSPDAEQPTTRWRIRRAIGAFWLVHLVASFAMATRLGSNGYYFLEAFSYGILLGVDWLSEKAGGEHSQRPWRDPALVALVLLYAAQAIPGVIRMTVDHPLDIALVETQRFSRDRVSVAEHVNKNGLRCFSDDPGLNVLLEHPQVLDPMVLSHLVQSGVMPMAALVTPVQDKAYDMVVLTARQWNYREVSHLPQVFVEALNDNYQVVQSTTGYLVLMPRKGSATP